MPLEDELRQQIKESVTQLEDITVSLEEVKVLADSNKRSSEQLANAAEKVGQLAVQTASIYKVQQDISKSLEDGVSAINATDPKAILNSLESTRGLTLEALDLSLTALQKTNSEIKDDLMSRLDTIEAAVGAVKKVAFTAAILAGIGSVIFVVSAFFQ
jgi:hypothetical protein